MRIRNLDDAVVEALKRRAKANRRSLEKELRAILEEAARAVRAGEAGEAGEQRYSGSRRALKLVTVRVGTKGSSRRSEIYDDEER